MRRIILFLSLTLSAFISYAQTTLPYQDPSLSPEKRAEDLIGRLSVEQKMSLLNYRSPEIKEFGIPVYNWWNEALHGSARNGLATVFPQAIGMAASWNEELLLKVFDVASTEQRIKFNMTRRGDGVRQYHGLTVWTPNINIFRDPRWGRGQETYGEDPYLTTVMGRSVVNGLQGDPNAEYDKLHACLKHFAVHSGPEYERHSFNAENLSYRDLNETYFYAFRNLVQTTDVKEVMCAYNAFDGEPCCGSNRLMTKILREQWGYQGLVVTDCWAVSDFYEPGRHNFSPDAASAAAHAVISGADLECGDSYWKLKEAYDKGQIDDEHINTALFRVLKARFELGEMDPMELVSWSSIPDEMLACDEHRALAYEMAKETMTLLQNRGNVLPLKKTGRYAVVGPNAADSLVMWGNYNGIPRRTYTVLDGIKEKVGAENVVYSQGCNIAAVVEDKGRYSETEGNAHDASVKSGGVSGQVVADMSIFDDVDAIIYVGGISPKLEGEEMPVHYEGFKGGDRTTIELPAPQREYIAKLAKTGKPVIFVHMSGSAVALAPESENCDAILQAWYGGEAGGKAVADVLFGDYNPAGRLPVTFYASNSDIPADFGEYDMEAGHTYRYFKGTPLFAFGHGLSYTTFKYGKAKYADGVLTIPVTNKGKRDGDEVVQVYIKRSSDVEGPNKSLRGFKRVAVKAGQTVNVEIPLGKDNLDLFNPATGNMEYVPGEYQIFYGGASDDVKSFKIHL